MTEQDLKECISEVKYSDIPKPTKKKIMNVLYEKLHNKETAEKNLIFPECDCQLRFCPEPEHGSHYRDHISE